MRLSTVFELLLIFLFIAFAASRSVDKKHHHHKHHGLSKSRQAPNTKPGSAAPNRYCQCTSLQCNCCRDFSLPVVSLKGPGCANVQYMNGDSMRLTMSFGDRVLRNITLSGKKPRPVCMGLPGADTKFCGRIYGIQRVGDQFKACLALEMRSLDEIEAALRVSCFKFGPDGVKLEPGRPVPGTDDYDDDDDYGFDEDDDDDDDDDFLADDDDDDEENDVESGDYTGFSALGDEFLDGFFGSGSSKKKKKTVSTTASPVKITKKPIISASTTSKTSANPSTTMPPSHLQNTTPGKPKNGSEPVMEEMNNTTVPSVIGTSTEFSVNVVQDGNTIEDTTSNNVTAQGTIANTLQNATVEGTVSDKENATTQSSKLTVDTKDEDEDEEEDEEEQEEEDEGEGSSNGGIVDAPKEKQELLQSKDDEENILDGILGSDDDDEDDDDEADENNNNKEEDDDEDDDAEDEFRQLRSHVPRGPYHPMTLEDQERRFPGLSALIKPPSVPFMSLPEQERRFPGLSALIRPPPVQQQQPEMAFDFPPVRSARNHRRMRLPPV